MKEAGFSFIENLYFCAAATPILEL